MTVQDWFEKRKQAQIQRREAEAKAELDINPDLWVKCVHCDAQLLKEDLVNNDMVCPVCDYHFRINARKRINQLFDENSFEELFTEIKPTDPLEFVDTESYKDRIEKLIKKLVLMMLLLQVLHQLKVIKLQLQLWILTLWAVQWAVL